MILVGQCYNTSVSVSVGVSYHFFSCDACRRWLLSKSTSDTNSEDWLAVNDLHLQTNKQTNNQYINQFIYLSQQIIIGYLVSCRVIIDENPNTFPSNQSHTRLICTTDNRQHNPLQTYRIHKTELNQHAKIVDTKLKKYQIFQSMHEKCF